MSFRLLASVAPPADPIEAELALLAQAHEPVAQLWVAPVSLVVPRSYRRYPSFEAACARFAAEGCPVHLRPSGGGLVPQGPGILNLSLAYTVRGLLGEWAEPIYLHLCELLRGPLRALGVETHWRAVQGSFCDGRFNLAWSERVGPSTGTGTGTGTGAGARKIAGTAQYWRPLPPEGAAPRPHAVLAHAVLLVDADLEAAHARANAFERALGSGRYYDPARTVSVAQALQPRAVPGLMDEVQQRLREALAAAQPPVLGSAAG